MWKFVVLALAVAAIAVAAVVAYASSGDDQRVPVPLPPVQPQPPSRSGPIDLGRARELIRDCRVRSTLSLHSGTFSLELKDGSRVDLPAATEREVYAEIQRATKRCGSVVIAME